MRELLSCENYFKAYTYTFLAVPMFSFTVAFVASTLAGSLSQHMQRKQSCEEDDDVNDIQEVSAFSLALSMTWYLCVLCFTVYGSQQLVEAIDERVMPKEVKALNLPLKDNQSIAIAAGLVLSVKSHETVHGELQRRVKCYRCGGSCKKTNDAGS